jgi:predicted DNA-binding transcriptional regulator YafY
MESEDKFILKASVANTQQFLWWLMSFGERVEVLEPQWLRDKLVKIAKDMIELYKS